MGCERKELKKNHILCLAGCVCLGVMLLGIGVCLGRSDSREPAVQSARTTAAYGKVSGTANYSAETALDSGALLSTSSAAQEDRKIVRTAQLDVEVSDIDAAMEAVKAQALSAGGEITTGWVSGKPGEGRYASMEISVPSEQLDAFLSGAGGLGEVTYSYSQQTDMTDQYTDNASRLESALAQKQRLDELYAQAENMADIVAITDALFEVQAEIDSLCGANASIDSRVDNAKVYVSLTEGEAEEEELPFTQRLSESLAAGFEDIGAFFVSLALFAAWALPWLAMIAALLLIVIGITRIVKRK